MTASERKLVDVRELARALNQRAPQLCSEIFPAGFRDGHEWRVGSLQGERGESLGVHLDGAKAGVWCDFSTGETGDALDLVAAARFGGDKAQAIRWAAGWLGADGAHAPPPAPRRERATDPREDREQRRNGAFRIWLGARADVLGTPVDTYLLGRGIPLSEFARQPRAIRFHPALWHAKSGRAWPAMVTAICGADGRFAAVHRTWLEAREGNVGKAPVEPAKAVLGDFRGAMIRLWRGASRRPFREMAPEEVLDLVEGIEDGLSVAWAAPECRVCAAVSLSNLAHLALPPSCRRVRLWRQNDTKAAAIGAFDRAARAHLEAGREVLIAHVDPAVKDVNDLLRADD